MKEFLKEYVQGLSECMDVEERVELTDKEIEKIVQILMTSYCWDMLNEEAFDAIYSIIKERKGE